MYASKYSTFDDEHFSYYYPTSIFNNSIANISWYYGDTLTITFNLSQITNTNATPEFMEGKQVVFTFYDFRYEEVYTRTYVPDNMTLVDSDNDDTEDTYTIEFVIDKDTSLLFKKGNYTCKMQLMDQDEEDRNITTILPTEQLLIRVK